MRGWVAAVGGIGEHDVFEFVVAGGQDGGTLVDFGRIEQVEDGKMLYGEDFVHAFEAEATLPVEKVGDVGLFKSGLLGEPESGQFTCFDALPEDLAKIILQDFELHGRSIAPVYSRERRRKRFPQARFGHPTLTEKIRGYRIATS